MGELDALLPRHWASAYALHHARQILCGKVHKKVRKEVSFLAAEKPEGMFRMKNTTAGLLYTIADIEQKRVTRAFTMQSRSQVQN